MKNKNSLRTPPRTRIAFRVGVVGHRLNRLPKDQATLDALRETVAILLEEVKSAAQDFQRSPEAASLYADASLTIRAISPLAEGADRIVAEEAIKLDYSLCCPMPFFQAEFENDFDPASIQQFRDLLTQAENGPGLVKFELDGRRNTSDEPDNEPNAYANASQIVLNQSDLLICIWDGGGSGGAGGTTETLQRALGYHVPTIWIDALKPHSWQCLRSTTDLDSLKRRGDRYEPKGEESATKDALRQKLADTVRSIVRGELGLPPEQRPVQEHTQQHPPTRTDAGSYFREKRPFLNLAFVWKLLRNTVNSDWPLMPALYVRDFVNQVRGDWPVSEKDMEKASKAPPSHVAAWVNSQLRGHYAWADNLADLYGDGYRSTYVLSYLISASAVFIALLPMAAELKGAADRWCIAGELGMLVVVLTLVWWSVRRHWHDRWMDYRLLAELIRQLRFLVPLGGGRPFPHVPDHLAVYGDPTQSWMYWHMRGLIRDIGLPGAVVTQAYIRECLLHMAEVVGTEQSGQLQFHNRARTRSENIHERLELVAIGLVVLTVLAASVHFTLAYVKLLNEPVETYVDHWLILASATFPALGAAFAGINNQGELVRLAKRSTAMVDGLNKIRKQIDELLAAPGPLSSENVVRLSRQLAVIMIQEVVDWRVMVTDRPPPAA